MTKVGISWDRSVVTALEIGRRQAVNVEELLALAYVLGVAPVHLLVPIDDDEAPYRIVPTSGVSAGHARHWIVGLWPLPSTDRRMYFAERPEHELVPPHADVDPRATRVYDLMRIDEELERRGLGDLRSEAAPEADDGER